MRSRRVGPLRSAGLLALLFLGLLPAGQLSAQEDAGPVYRSAMLYVRLGGPHMHSDLGRDLTAAIEEQIQTLRGAPPSRERDELTRRVLAMWSRLIDVARTGSDDFDAWLADKTGSMASTTDVHDMPIFLDMLTAAAAQLRREKDWNNLPVVEMERIVLRRNMAAQGRRGGDPFPQNQWQADLAEFVKAYPNHRLAARAKLDLAEGAEHAGRLDEARQWYRQVDEGFAESASARIARGALFRLDGLGRRVDLRTTDSAGNPLDLEDLRGRVVVIHFWTYDTPSSLDEGQKLLDLQGTHADRVAIVAVNLDACPRDRAIDRRLGDGDCVDILDDSADVDSLAIRFGVQRAPTTLVLDGGGKLVARGARGGRLLERHLLGYETKPAQLPRSESTAAATAP